MMHWKLFNKICAKTHKCLKSDHSAAQRPPFFLMSGQWNTHSGSNKSKEEDTFDDWPAFLVMFSVNFEDVRVISD